MHQVYILWSVDGIRCSAIVKWFGGRPEENFHRSSPVLVYLSLAAARCSDRDFLRGDGVGEGLGVDAVEPLPVSLPLRIHQEGDSRAG